MEEESARKRRRVSPDPDDAPVAAAAAAAAAAPPPASDADSTVNNPPAPQSPPTRRIRPSFAPPTRADLGHYNPQTLLERRSASASPSLRTTDFTSTRRPTIPPSPVRGAQQLFRPQAVRAPPPPSTTLVDSPAAEVEQVSVRPRDAPRSREAASDSVASARSVLGSPPRRPPVKPIPRPLPPPAPEGNDELNTVLARNRQIARNSAIITLPPPAEPDLPPAVFDPVSSKPPRGIHSSPRWREKGKRKKSSPMKSSPLKPRTESPFRTPRGRRPSQSRSQSQSQSQSQSPYPTAGWTGRPLQDLELNANTNAARQVPALNNKNAGKTRERDRLRREVAALRKEIGLAARENERIRAMHRAGRIVAPANEEDVLNLVQKTLVATRTAPSPGLAHQMAQAALKPIGILPFGPSKLVPQQGDSSDDNEQDIKSHHPVQMSADEELPFLQLFSPFSATSQISVLPAVPNQPLRQRRQIMLRSRDIPGLFTARVDMIVNAMNLNILALKVPALEPSARPELGDFVHKICNGDCNRSMHHNIGIISWAMGEWYRLAIQRARFWVQLERSLTAKDDLFKSVARLRSGAGEEQAGQDLETEDEALDKCDKADLIRFMGQRSYEIAIPKASEAGAEAALRIEWNIHLDWTGEAQSKMGLFLGIPGKWRKADDRGVFAKFPKLFEDLIEGGQHPRKAVRTMVALLTSF